MPPHRFGGCRNRAHTPRVDGEDRTDDRFRPWSGPPRAAHGASLTRHHVAAPVPRGTGTSSTRWRRCVPGRGSSPQPYVSPSRRSAGGRSRSSPGTVTKWKGAGADASTQMSPETSTLQAQLVTEGAGLRRHRVRNPRMRGVTSDGRPLARALLALDLIPAHAGGDSPTGSRRTWALGGAPRGDYVVGPCARAGHPHRVRTGAVRRLPGRARPAAAAPVFNRDRGAGLVMPCSTGHHDARRPQRLVGGASARSIRALPATVAARRVVRSRATAAPDRRPRVRNPETNVGPSSRRAPTTRQVPGRYRLGGRLGVGRRPSNPLGRPSSGTAAAILGSAPRSRNSADALRAYRIDPRQVRGGAGDGRSPRALRRTSTPSPCSRSTWQRGGSYDVVGPVRRAAGGPRGHVPRALGRLER
jgi:hypothetical protein